MFDTRDLIVFRPRISHSPAHNNSKDIYSDASAKEDNSFRNHIR